MVDFLLQKKHMPLLTPPLGCLPETPALYLEGREEEREKTPFVYNNAKLCHYSTPL